MEKVMVLMVFTALSFFGNTQQVSEGERRGLVQTTASIYPTLLTNNGSWLNRVGGHAEYFFDDHYSFRGSLFHYFSTQKGTDVLNTETSVFSGFDRTFISGRFDFYVGIGAGMSFVSMIEPQPSLYYQSMLDTHAGVKFHVYDYFYFFGEIHSQWLRNPKRNELLNMVPISGGLGLQFPTRRK